MSAEERPRDNTKRVPRCLIVAMLAGALGGCQAGYVLRQGWSQWALSRARVALDDPALEESLSSSQRERLRWVPRILKFSREELGLDPGDAYTTFLDTRGEPVTHVVTAAHPLALIAYQWCFPFVGCVTYKGFFDAEDAEAEAAALAEEGWDVSVDPVAAYSTLGWFQDPLLSGMLDYEVPHLAEVLIHEVTHRTLYLPGSTELNESLATHVGRAGAILFLDRYPGAASEAEVADYIGGLEAQDELDDLVERLERDLETLYRDARPEDEKYRRKREIFSSAARAAELRGFARSSFPTSNASLVARSRYRRFLEPLERLQARLGGHPRDLMAYLQKMCCNGEQPEKVLSEEWEPGRS